MPLSRRINAAATTVVVCLALTTNLLGENRPNIVVIFTDDHGYSDLGSQGIVSDLKTPFLDQVASGGVRMSSGYVTAPQCVPSRGGLLSGRYQNKFGLESNAQAQQPNGLEGFNASHTMAERLQSAGYRTGMAGKWHLGPSHEIPKHGFDKYFHKNSARPAVCNIDLAGKDRKPGPLPTDVYHIEACSQAACSFIERYKKEPFFFYLAYRAPHVPLDAPEKFLSRFPGKMPERRRQALAMLAAVDDGVGQILATLRKNDLEQNTLLFVISDNGAPLKIHKIDAPGGGPGWDGSLNDPLNGEKGMLSEGGIRTPFLAYWKGKLPAGKVVDAPVISLDVAATAVALAGLPKSKELDGEDLIPFLTGQTNSPPHEELFWRWEGQAAVRRDNWKYITMSDRQWLFDLKVDPGETRNLMKEFPNVASELRQKWEDWSQDLTPPGLDSRERAAAKKYFDWYLDGIRDAGPPSAMSPQKENRKPADAAKTRAGAARQAGLSDLELFQRRDKDKDARVTWEEFLNGRSGTTVAALKRRFDARDQDKDGVWEASEVKPKGPAKLDRREKTSPPDDTSR